jgi:hypothetical protein
MTETSDTAAFRDWLVPAMGGKTVCVTGSGPTIVS